MTRHPIKWVCPTHTVVAHFYLQIQVSDLLRRLNPNIAGLTDHLDLVHESVGFGDVFVPVSDQVTLNSQNCWCIKLNDVVAQAFDAVDVHGRVGVVFWWINTNRPSNGFWAAVE